MKKRLIVVSLIILILSIFTGCSEIFQMQNSNQEEEQIDEIEQKQEVLPEFSEVDKGVSEHLKAGQIGQFYFDQLDIDDQVVYAEILSVLQNCQEKIALSCLDTGKIERIFQYVLNDHPEIFYVEGYTFTKYTIGDYVRKITFSGTYTMDQEEIARRKGMIDSYVQECLAGITFQMDEYEITKYIYEYIIDRTEYDASVEDNQNVCSVFLYGKSVCQGYAKATQYLLERAGIETTLIMGQVLGGEGHAWNLVRLDGAWYFLDTTWGDASYQMTGGVSERVATEIPPINYDYLLVTTDQLLKTHLIDTGASVPICEETKDNYYVREGSFFTNLDEEKLQAFFEQEYQKGKTYLTMKCANESVYREMVTYLIEEQKIFQYLQNGEGSVSYADNEQQLTLSFWL